MKFSRLSEYLVRLEETSSRLAITEILSELFRESSSEDIRDISYLILGRLGPSYEEKVFNVAERMMIMALSKMSGKEAGEVRILYKKSGDLGNVSEELKRNSKFQIINAKLSVKEVYGELVKIADDQGEGSVERKIKEVSELLKKLDPHGCKYVVRIILGKLRLGFSDKTILDALSYLEKGDKSLKGELARAQAVLPDVGLLAEKVKKVGVEGTGEVDPVCGVPVLPMLAQRLKTPEEMIEKMGEVSVEPKFDGLRVQIHFKRDKFVKAYTRNLNEASWMFPELSGVGRQIRAGSAILDSEAVGLSEDMKKMVSFQKTMTRRRKHGVEERSKEIPIAFQVFDVLSCDGKNMMRKAYVERRGLLRRILKTGKVLRVDDYKLTKDPGVISSEHEFWIAKGLEGVIVKKVKSKYVPGRTGWRWVKMKEEVGREAKLADTVDAVVMGYYQGRGKRAGFGIGGFLVGLYELDKFLSLTKIGTGLTDGQFRELKSRLLKLEVEDKPREYGEVDKSLVPDKWVRPGLVVEIAADEITKSDKYSSGYSLRFPRLVRFRDDKSPKQTTGLKEIRELM